MWIWFGIVSRAVLIQYSSASSLSFQIEEVNALVIMSRKLVGHFKHSTVATLKERHNHILIQDCPTRWNSTYYMMERLQDSRRHLTDVLLDDTVSKAADRKLLLQDHEWDLLEELLPILSPLEMATKELSADKYVSISIMYPILFGLMEHFEDNDDDSETLIQVKHVVRESLCNRFKLDNIDICKEMPILATALDPRFKSLDFLPNDFVVAAFDELGDRLPQTSPDEQPPSKKKKTALSALLGKKKANVSTSSQIGEVQQYRSLPEEDEDTDPLSWWKGKSETLPNLAKLAQQYLAIPATSSQLRECFPAWD